MPQPLGLPFAGPFPEGDLVTRLDEEGLLTLNRQAVPTVPAELQPRADQAVRVDTAGRLLE